jgi:prepilin-type N-terminal cleavage/methylation domain-containing protein
MAWKTPAMTSVARTNNHRAGFTLLELVIVLAIASVVMGGVVGYMIYSADERVLRDTSGEIELLAKRARTTSILHQTPYALEFREGVVRMLPLAQAGRDEKRTTGGRRIGGEPEEEAAAAGGESHSYQLDPAMKIFVKRWDSDKWIPTEKDTVHIWRFDPDGLSEPISVRYALEKSWAEDTYHPLTATIRESLLEAR